MKLYYKFEINLPLVGGKLKINLFVILLFFLYSFIRCKNNFETVNVKQFEDLIKEDNVTIWDVRTEEEFKSGHIENAINIDYYSDDFIKNCKNTLNKDSKIAIYCQSGYRSKKSARLLSKEKFTVINLKGGIDIWKKYNKKTVK